MSETLGFYKNVLQNMSDGVMTLEMGGNIIMFNPAAAEILGLKAEDVLGKKFAEIFLMQVEGNDEFNQNILDAIYESAMVQNSIVAFSRPDGKSVFLSVTSSYLKKESPGGMENQGVIVVFRDITEIKKLQDAEKKLNQELRDAYLTVEESNNELQTALKKVQVVRAAATGFVIVLFLGLGMYLWNRKPIDAASLQTPRSVSPARAGEVSTFVVRATPLSSSISLAGTLEPRERVNIISSFKGNVKEICFQYGQEVKKDDILLRLDTSEIEVKVRNAKSDYIKALQKHRKLQDWEQGREVATARRALTKAELAMDSARRKQEETKMLFEKGIVSANENQTTLEEARNARMAFRAAEEELQSVLEKGSPENVNVARMELENARTRKEEMEAKMEMSDVRAPVSGVVVQVSSPDKTQKSKLEVGVQVAEAEVLLAVGNLEGLSVRAEVDEVDIGKIKTGQPVSVTGDAFPGLCLEGSVTSISFQASKSAGAIPMFDVLVTIDRLSPDQRKKIRLGMSSTLEVRVYNNPGALLVPIEAVWAEGGQKMITLKDEATEKFRDVAVETGITTLSAVEITKGLKAGDGVVTAGGANDAGALGDDR